MHQRRVPWALASALFGFGLTFFSGAVQAWVVDALNATGYRGSLESVSPKAKSSRERQC